LQTALAVKNKGSVSIRPYTATGYIDAVKLIYVGMTQSELTARELGTPTYLHPSFRTLFVIFTLENAARDWLIYIPGSMAVNMLNYPGTTFLDMDCETSEFYEGKLPGTVSISGYSEEYREHQLSKYPMLVLALEGTVTLPTMEIDKIVERIQSLQRRVAPTDNTALRDMLGLSQCVKDSIVRCLLRFLIATQGEHIAVWVVYHWRCTEANRGHLHGVNPQPIRRPDPLY
jgi:hypothetical protein